MSLLSTIIKAAATAFKAAGDVPASAIVRSGLLASYDPAADVTTKTWGSERPVTLIAYGKREDGGANEPKHQGRMIAFQAAEVDLAPTEETEVEIGGVIHKVVSVETDPAGALFILELEK